MKSLTLCLAAVLVSGCEGIIASNVVTGILQGQKIKELQKDRYALYAEWVAGEQEKGLKPEMTFDEWVESEIDPPSQYGIYYNRCLSYTELNASPITYKNWLSLGEGRPKGKKPQMSDRKRKSLRRRHQLGGALSH